MLIKGRRFHIAGSANPSTETSKLKYAHELITELVTSLAKQGASFCVQFGRDPKHNDDKDLSILFDWDVISTTVSLLRNGAIQPTTSPIFATVETTKTKSHIQDTDSESMWEYLIETNQIIIQHVPAHWTSGALRRSQLVALGDVLILISGGEGVEHLAEQYILAGKPVIPLDLDLGSSKDDGHGGAAAIYQKFLRNPKEYLSFLNEDIASASIHKIATENAAKNTTIVVNNILELLANLKPPTAFFIRLLNSSAPEFDDVEDYFRNVVDIVARQFGYEPIEMGRQTPINSLIDAEIFSRIHTSGIIVADLTAARPNCFIELGYALARQRPVILTIREEGFRLPFDIASMEFHIWSNRWSEDEARTKLQAFWQRNQYRPPLVQLRSINA